VRKQSLRLTGGVLHAHNIPVHNMPALDLGTADDGGEEGIKGVSGGSSGGSTGSSGVSAGSATSVKDCCIRWILVWIHTLARGLSARGSGAIDGVGHASTASTATATATAAQTPLPVLLDGDTSDDKSGDTSGGQSSGQSSGRASVGKSVGRSVRTSVRVVCHWIVSAVAVAGCFITVAHPHTDLGMLFAQQPAAHDVNAVLAFVGTVGTEPLTVGATATGYSATAAGYSATAAGYSAWAAPDAECTGVVMAMDWYAPSHYGPHTPCTHTLIHYTLYTVLTAMDWYCNHHHTHRNSHTHPHLSTHTTTHPTTHNTKGGAPCAHTLIRYTLYSL
jgi:hypothetical protein